jgi:hypothetical protein
MGDDWTPVDEGTVPNSLPERRHDPMADRPMTPGEALSLLREAVSLNILATKYNTRGAAVERDRIVARLESLGFDHDVTKYKHPSDVDAEAERKRREQFTTERSEVKKHGFHDI